MLAPILLVIFVVLICFVFIAEYQYFYYKMHKSEIDLQCFNNLLQYKQHALELREHLTDKNLLEKLDLFEAEIDKGISEYKSKYEGE